MPSQTQTAVNWSLQQTYDDGMGNQVPITKDTPQPLVDAMRKYFNQNSIQYSTFSYDDLKPYL
ncbi:hypothetical protein [Alicyclobacillus shizuokensis]|uniref:hypothetical protein n=1 Tax=Alicyclobacillus shizuokensis TaxID=392014 RepID=UPI0012EDC833|nr:hypothetical protein [Alicyclobacillus shizuokensis]